jgi:hypothetical protein
MRTISSIVLPGTERRMIGRLIIAADIFSRIGPDRLNRRDARFSSVDWAAEFHD